MTEVMVNGPDDVYVERKGRDRQRQGGQSICPF
jgi:Flp pilus assembly CpaF family ATPase